ncbi:MAG: hypothetical protein NZ750_08985 [Anaerolineae bacterium]|nr:hypothetical protein [Anaerolineae bacterium]MDW8171752.1 hypothetical protein [Anaerolineae bacterium]
MSLRSCLLMSFIVAYGLRLLLIADGGQQYWPDEMRYQRGYYMAMHLLRADFFNASRELALYPDHSGFTLVSLPMGWFHRLFGRFDEGFWFAPSLLYALFSAAGVVLIGWIAARSLRSDRAGVIASLLSLASTALYQWSRHHVPYDVSLFCALLALALSLEHGGHWWRAVASGFLVVGVFVIYNGYWLLAAVVGLWVLVSWLNRANLRLTILRSAALISGGLIWALAHLVWMLPFGHNPLAFLSLWRQFSGTVIQGDYAEGWTLSLEYLWAVEGPLALVWIVGLLLSLGRRKRIVFAWWVSLLTMWIALGVLSQAEIFVVYGRLARQMLPFIIWLAAAGLERGLQLLNRRVVWIGAAGLALAVYLINWYPLLDFAFGVDVYAQAQAQYEDVGVIEAFASGAEASLPLNRYWLYATDHQAPFRYAYPFDRVVKPPSGRVIWQMANPWNYRPYLYEGFTRSMRELVSSYDLSYRLIERLEPGE